MTAGGHGSPPLYAMLHGRNRFLTQLDLLSELITPPRAHKHLE